MPTRSKPLKEDAGKNSILHAILFPKLKFTLNDAKKWLENNNYKYIHNRDTKNIHRFRIKEQIKGYKFFTVKLPSFVELVYMYKSI
jgi:hypothetical protein